MKEVNYSISVVPDDVHKEKWMVEIYAHRNNKHIKYVPIREVDKDVAEYVLPHIKYAFEYGFREAQSIICSTTYELFLKLE